MRASKQRIVPTSLALPALWFCACNLVVTALSLIGFLNYVSYRALAGNPADPLVVGRYLNAGIALWAIAIVVAIWTFPRRVRPVLAGATVAAGALLQLGGLALTLTRFYA